MSKFFRKRQYYCVLALFPSYSYIDTKIEKCNFGLDQITTLPRPLTKISNDTLIRESGVAAFDEGLELASSNKERAKDNPNLFY